MDALRMPQIIGLYKKCGLDSEENYPIRTEINTGTLSNRLNTGSLNSDSGKQVVWSGSTVDEKNR